MIVDVVPDEDMPVDEEGNRAEIVMDGMSTINRMNVSRLMEHTINAASRDVSKRIAEMYRHGASRQEMSRYLLGYYQIVNPSMVELVVDDHGLVKEDHLQSVVSEGIYIWYPTDNDPEPMDIIKQIYEHYRPTYGPVTYRGMSGEFKKTASNILIGSMYIMLLEKTGKNWSAVSMSKLNHFGAPAKLTTTDRNNSPARVQPIRFGESEARLFASMVGGVPTANLFDRTNNPFVRKVVQENILRADQPTNIDTVIDRSKYPNGQGRILSLIRHIGECSGYRFVRDE